MLAPEKSMSRRARAIRVESVLTDSFARRAKAACSSAARSWSTFAQPLVSAQLGTRLLS